MIRIAHAALSFIHFHPEWAFGVMFAVSFSESFAFLSFAVPGTTIIIAAGMLIPSGILPVWPALIGAILGATLGDSISYWLGRHFGPALMTWWPFSRHPELFVKGRRFFERYGRASVFVGRFFGPFRAVVPLTAGILKMPQGPFLIANVASAVIWAPVLLFGGWFATTVVGTLQLDEDRKLMLSLGFIFLIGITWFLAKHAAPRFAKK